MGQKASKPSRKASSLSHEALSLSHEASRPSQEAAEPTTKEIPECPFWSLPQELQDIIFAYAYAQSTTHALPLISRNSWNIRHGISYGTNPRPNPFKRVVDDFLVSKRFFSQAASAWIGSRSWDSNDRVDFYTRDLVCNTGLLRQFIKHLCPVDVSIYTVKYLSKDIARMDSLQSLTIQVDEVSDRDIFGTEKCPLSEAFLREDILVLPIVSDVLGFNKNIRFVRIVTTPYYNWRGYTSEWLENLEAMQQVMQSIIDKRQPQENRFSQPADKGTWLMPLKELRNKVHICKPLYQGSRVCGSCSYGKWSLSLTADTPRRPTWIKPRFFEDLPDSMEGMRELVDDHRDSAAEWLWKFRQEKMLMLKDAPKE